MASTQKGTERMGMSSARSVEQYSDNNKNYGISNPERNRNMLEKRYSSIYNNIIYCDASGYKFSFRNAKHMGKCRATAI